MLGRARQKRRRGCARCTRDYGTPGVRASGLGSHPAGQLRERIGELDPARRYIILCAVGVRAYNASRILSAHGFKNVLVYPGGTHFYRSTHFPLF
ncbi:rhodanese-like domain-containing protein [Anaerotruncus colihominis]|uniref:rhodanese-like domain-containing protein n=1 Tax=Anaerotruncus colihominis TaxID=169435 RepID=UPI00321ABE03